MYRVDARFRRWGLDGLSDCICFFPFNFPLQLSGPLLATERFDITVLLVLCYLNKVHFLKIIKKISNLNCQAKHLYFYSLSNEKQKYHQLKPVPYPVLACLTVF